MWEGLWHLNWLIRMNEWFAFKSRTIKCKGGYNNYTSSKLRNFLWQLPLHWLYIFSAGCFATVVRSHAKWCFIRMLSCSVQYSSEQAASWTKEIDCPYYQHNYSKYGFRYCCAGKPYNNSSPSSNNFCFLFYSWR
jgi:hypothetical protein